MIAHPTLAVYRDNGRLLADCPACGQAGLVSQKQNGLIIFDCFAQCGAGSGIYRQAGTSAEQAGTSAERKLRKLNVTEMVRTMPPPVPWAVEGLVVERMTTCLNGRHGEGKSLLAFSLAAGVATGHAEAGLDCEAGRVVIIDAENGAYEIHRRVHTLELPAANVVLVEAEGFDLRSHSDMDELEELLRREQPRLVVLDSFRTLWRGDENDAGQVERVLTPLRNLIRSVGAGGLLLHHSGKNDALDYRGSSAIGDNVELGFTLGREKDDGERDRRYLRCWKCRPAPEPAKRWLRLAVERGRVYVDESEPPEGGEPDRGGRPPVVRQELRPKLIAALTDEPQRRADLARAVGRGPKDRSVGRVLEQLLAEEIAAKRGEGWTRGEGWQNTKTPRDVGGSATPRCSCENPGLPADDGRCSRCWGWPT